MVRGIKITKDSKGLDSTRQEDLYVDSTTPLFKLFLEGKGVQRFVGTFSETYAITITHNLGYIPFHLVFADESPGTNRTLCNTFINTDSNLSGNVIGNYLSSVNTKTIVLNMGLAGATPTAGDYGYSYFIYYDSLSEGII